MKLPNPIAMFVFMLLGAVALLVGNHVEQASGACILLGAALQLYGGRRKVALDEKSKWPCFRSGLDAALRCGFTKDPQPGSRAASVLLFRRLDAFLYRRVYGISVAWTDGELYETWWPRDPLATHPVGVEAASFVPGWCYKLVVRAHHEWRVRSHRLRVAACASVGIGLLTLAFTGCGGNSTPVQTSAGPTPANILVTQDTAGDALNAFSAAQNAAVKAHDARPICSASVTTGCDAQAVHAARSARLKTSASALRAGWDGLSTWKRVGGASPPSGVFCALAKAAPALLADAASLGAPSQKVDVILKFASAILSAGCTP